MKQLPKVKNVASFDSAFHQHMPDYAKTYAIDQKIAKEKGLRKYGFHGISYSYITRTVAKHLQKTSSELNIIALHLGSGASACAIKNGQSIDTSMGLTPLSGLPGGSRSGDIDPSLIFHYTSSASKISPSSTKDLHISEAEDILNKQSGWKALAGTTDFSKIADPNAPKSHKLAFDIFLDRIVGYVGAYFVKLDGKVDALVFAGGIGEKSALLRERVVQKCSCLGFALDQQRNNDLGQDRVVEIGKVEKSVTLVCRTDEEVRSSNLRGRNSVTISSTRWHTAALQTNHRCCSNSTYQQRIIICLLDTCKGHDMVPDAHIKISSASLHSPLFLPGNCCRKTDIQLITTVRTTISPSLEQLLAALLVASLSCYPRHCQRSTIYTYPRSIDKPFSGRQNSSCHNLL
jgi:hypothetical protein